MGPRGLGSIKQKMFLLSSYYVVIIVLIMMIMMIQGQGKGPRAKARTQQKSGRGSGPGAAVFLLGPDLGPWPLPLALDHHDHHDQHDDDYVVTT